MRRWYRSEVRSTEPMRSRWQSEIVWYSISSSLFAPLLLLRYFYVAASRHTASPNEASHCHFPAYPIKRLPMQDFVLPPLSVFSGMELHQYHVSHYPSGNQRTQGVLMPFDCRSPKKGGEAEKISSIRVQRCTRYPRNSFPD